MSPERTITTASGNFWRASSACWFSVITTAYVLRLAAAGVGATSTRCPAVERSRESRRGGFPSNRTSDGFDVRAIPLRCGLPLTVSFTPHASAGGAIDALAISALKRIAGIVDFIA